jgi:hypothetical protein
LARSSPQSLVVLNVSKRVGTRVLWTPELVECHALGVRCWFGS